MTDPILIGRKPGSELVLRIFNNIKEPHMNTKVLTTLEYNKIIDLLTEKADSEPGKKLCRDLVPSTDLSAIRTAQRETKDALARLFRIGSTSFGSNRDLGFSIRSLEIGSSLAMSELLKLASFSDNVSRIKTYGKKNGKTSQMTAWMPTLRDLLL